MIGLGKVTWVMCNYGAQLNDIITGSFPRFY